MIHHSLYRITPNDLARFSEFAEGIERVVQTWHGHSTFTRSLVRNVRIAIVTVLLVDIWCFILLYMNRKAIKSTGINSVQEERLRRLRRKIFISAAGVLAAISVFFVWIYTAEAFRLRLIDWIVWIVLVFFIIAIGLSICILVYTNACKRIKNIEKKNTILLALILLICIIVLSTGSYGY